MADVAGSVEIMMKLNVSNYSAGMEKIQGQLKRFDTTNRTVAHGSVQPWMASSAAIRLLSGDITNNIRAAERFVATMPGVQKAVMAAFPVVGVIALAGVLMRLGKEVTDFVENLHRVPQALANAFASRLLEGQDTIDQLRRENDLLDNQIAKFEGKPQNNLALAFDDTDIAANKLQKDLMQVNDALDQLLSKNKVPWYGIFLGKDSTSYLAGTVKYWNQELADRAKDFNDAVHAYGDKSPQAETAKSVLDQRRKDAEWAMQGEIWERTPSPYRSEDMGGDQTANLTIARGYLAMLKQQDALESLEGSHAQKLQKSDQLKNAQEFLAKQKELAAQRMQAMEQQLAEKKDLQEMDVADDYIFWQGKLATLHRGDLNYRPILEKAGAAWQQVLKEQGAQQEQYEKQLRTQKGPDALLGLIAPRPFQGMYGQTTAAPELKRPGDLSAIPSSDDVARIHQQSNEQISYLKTLNDQISVRRSLSDSLVEFSIKTAAARGEMSKMAAAEAVATLHAEEYSSALARLQATSKYVSGIGGLSDLDRNKQLAAIKDQLNMLNGARALQIVEENASVDESTLSGSVRRTMNLYVQEATDTGAQVSKILTDAFQGTNSTLSQSLMAHAYNGQEYRRNIVQGLSNTSRGLGSQFLDSGFKQVEGGVLGHFGFGSKTKPDGSQSNPLWVKWAETNPAATSAMRSLGFSAAMPASLSTSSKAFADLIDSPPAEMTAAADVVKKLTATPLPSLPSGSGGSGSVDWNSFFSGASGALPNGVDLNDAGGSDNSGSMTITKPGQSGIGNFVQKLVSSGLHLLPGFADGGPISSNMPAIVGENGPEVFMPSSAGRIIPNDQISVGGGGSTHHVYVDARGSTDPAQTEAAVHRAMRQYLPQAVAASMSAAKENRLRRPGSAR